MNDKMVRKLWTIVVLNAVYLSPTVLFACQNTAPTDSNTSQLEKLEAFAKTFGYVRYFHPSDQASLIDWEAMAYFGVEKVMNSPADQSVEDLLRELFNPIVVDLEVYEGPEQPRPETTDVPADKIVAWQHVGVGMQQKGLYSSVRTNRVEPKTKPAKPSPFGNLMQRIDPNDLKGKEIRFRFDARCEEGNCRMQGWWRVDRESRETGLFENMGNRPIRSKDWKEYELVGTVDEDANNLIIGVMFFGQGSGLVDNVRFDQKLDGKWQPVSIGNPDFEEGKSRPDRWFLGGNGFSLKTTSEDASNGKRSVRILRGTGGSSGQLFDEIPELGEVVDSAVARNLRVRFPLALSTEHGYKHGEDESTDAFVASVKETDVPSSNQQTTAVANAILLWNVFQHFYPYFEQVETDWDATLLEGLQKALVSSTREQTTQTLQWIVAQLHDGHGMVFDAQANSQQQVAKVNFSWIENQLVVTASDEASIKVGSVVSEIDGQTAREYLEKKEQYLSGSPQWKRHRSCQMISMGKPDSPLPIVLKFDDDVVKTELAFQGRKQAKVDKGEICRILSSGNDDSESEIWYIDMGRAEPKDVNDKLDRFAKAKGIVLDFRGYPRGTQFLFQHMTDEHMQSQQWQVPKQVRPDRVDMKQIETMGRWEMPPRKPRFQGKMVFLTNGSAISYAESCMAIVANYKLGEIIGSPTAGANGNVNPFGLPGGYRVSWTGMRVMNHDDSQHHVRGIQPTIPMQPTIKGIRAGKDELLDRAVELIEAG